MNLDRFVSIIKHKDLLLAPAAIDEYEKEVGASLPMQYKNFLQLCNGGSVGGNYSYKGKVYIDCIGGIRTESYLSLKSNRDNYQDPKEIRIPTDLIWIMSDPYGNAICLGLTGSYRGRVYFWDHEGEPDPDEWDGKVESAENIELIASSFGDFIDGIRKEEDDKEVQFTWLPDYISPKLIITKKGYQYLEVHQELPEGVSGFSESIFDIPQDWKVICTEIVGDQIAIHVKGKGVYTLNKENFGALSSSLPGPPGEQKPDQELESIWTKYGKGEESA